MYSHISKFRHNPKRVPPYTMISNTGIKTAHLRSPKGRAAQNKRARERLKRLKMEKAIAEKASPPTPLAQPRRGSGEAYNPMNCGDANSKIDRQKGRRSKEATHRRYTRRAAKRMLAKIKAENRIGKYSQ